MNKKRNIQVMISTGIAAVVMLMLCLFVPYKKVNGWTCALTGSQKGNVTWFGCFTVSNWYQLSPIEEWLAYRNDQIEHNWVRTEGTSRFIFGSQVFSHSIAPAVLNFPADLQKRFLTTTSAEEIETFLKLLKSGDQDKIREAVNRLSEKIMKDM